jgi:hypothetical protein
MGEGGLMASVRDVRQEREAPIVANLSLTENELRRVFDNAISDAVLAERASAQALTDLGEAAMWTLAEKVRGLYRPESR